MSVFIIWAAFVETEMCNLLADMMHYISGPDLAWAELEFQYIPNDCFLDNAFVGEIMACPVNFLYLTTGLGDRDSQQ